MKLKLIFLFVILKSIEAFSEEKPLLFEDYWQRNNIHFKSLSENIVPKISSNDMPMYEKFVQRCMQGHNNSLLLYTDRKKTTFHCSQDKEKLKEFVNNDKQKYLEILKEIGEFLKQGKIIEFKNLGKKNALCCMQAEVCPNWENINPIFLGYLIKLLAEELESGDFEIEKCKVRVIHFDKNGNI